MINVIPMLIATALWLGGCAAGGVVPRPSKVRYATVTSTTASTIVCTMDGEGQSGCTLRVSSARPARMRVPTDSAEHDADSPSLVFTPEQRARGACRRQRGTCSEDAIDTLYTSEFDSDGKTAECKKTVRCWAAAVELYRSDIKGCRRQEAACLLAHPARCLARDKRDRCTWDDSYGDDDADVDIVEEEDLLDGVPDQMEQGRPN